MSDMEAPLQYDIIELTFLLKAIGFQLKSFEFYKIDSTANREIVLDINCQASGFKTKFVLSSEQCTCPSKPSENNNSFWEIQGRSPSDTAQKIMTDSSCTLLPPISKTSIGLGRSTLLMLLHHYRNDISNETANNETKSQDYSKISNAISPIPSIRANNVDPARFSTPVHAINMPSTPILGNEKLGSIPKINLETMDTAEIMSHILSTNITSDSFVSPIPVRNATAPGVIFPSPQINPMEADRDVFIIESISKARKELDAALLHLKCNITRDLSESSFLANTTMPRDLKLLINSPKSSTSIDIRKDITTKALEQFQFSKPQLKKPLSSVPCVSKLKPTTATKGKVTNPGTPRPQVDLKATVDKGIAKSKMLRSTSSVTLKPSAAVPPQITKQKSALTIKK